MQTIYPNKKIKMRGLCLLACVSLCVVSLRAQQFIIKGRVATAKGHPLAGATVRLLGADSAQLTIALTDSLGLYNLSTSNRDRAILSARYLGYQEEKHPITITSHQQDVDFFLKEQVEALGAVFVKGESLKSDGRWRFTLTPEQRQRSYTGYDLIQNLMLPGVSVNKQTNTVTMLGEEVPVYIDGRRASTRELLSLRKHEIDKVDFYDFPTGRFIGDIVAINILVKKEAGGHISLDAEESLGSRLGKYNAVAKYTTQAHTLAFWAGLAHQNNTHSVSLQENYSQQNALHSRIQSYQAKEREHHYYMQASWSKQQKGNIWMFKPGFSYTRPRNEDRGQLSTSEQVSSTIVLQEQKRSIAPHLFTYGYLNLSPRQNLELSLDGVYTTNQLQRLFIEGNTHGQLFAKETLLKINAVASYNHTLANQGTFSLRLSQHYKNSQTGYTIDGGGHSEHLLSYENILWLGYSQSLNKHTMIRLQAGGSLQAYQLQAQKAVIRISPRLNLALFRQKRGLYSAQLGLNIGNTYPDIHTLNQVSYKLNTINKLRGNPNLSISYLLSPFAGYTQVLGKLMLHSKINYLYVIDPVVADYQMESGFLVRSYVNRGFWHDLRAELGISWRPYRWLDIQLLLRGNYMENTSNNRRVWSPSLENNARFTWGSWSCGGGLKTPYRTLSFSSEIRRMPWVYNFFIGYSAGAFQAELNAYNLLLGERSISNHTIEGGYERMGQMTSLQTTPYVSLRLAYTLSIGKKVRQAPRYIRQASESAILQ